MEETTKSSSEKMIDITTQLFRGMGMFDKLSEKDIELVNYCLKSVAWAGELDEIKNQKEYVKKIQDVKKEPYEITKN